MPFPKLTRGKEVGGPWMGIDPGGLILACRCFYHMEKGWATDLARKGGMDIGPVTNTTWYRYTAGGLKFSSISLFRDLPCTPDWSNHCEKEKTGVLLMSMITDICKSLSFKTLSIFSFVFISSYRQTTRQLTPPSSVWMKVARLRKTKQFPLNYSANKWPHQNSSPGLKVAIFPGFYDPKIS